MSVGRTAAVIGSVAAGLTMAVSGAVPVYAAANTYSGRAYAVGISGATVLGTAVGNTTIVDTGQLASSGGSVSNGPGTFNVLSLGTVTVTKEQATGGAGTAAANSVVSDASLATTTMLGVPTPILHATVLTAATTTRACGAAPSVSSSVASLTLGTTIVAVPVNPRPNTTMSVVTAGVLIATVTFNAQTYDAATNKQSASALVVDFPTSGALSSAVTGVITISHAESGVAGCDAGVLPASTSPGSTSNGSTSSSGGALGAGGNGVLPANDPAAASGALPVPDTGARGASPSAVWSLALIPAGALLAGLSLLGVRRRSATG